MVARLTPDQKAACSNHVGVSLFFFPGSQINICLLLICIAVRNSRRRIGMRKYWVCTGFVLATGRCFSTVIVALVLMWYIEKTGS